MSLKRMSTATKYITDIFEYVDSQYYDDVSKDNINKYIASQNNTTTESSNLNKKGYLITVSVDNDEPYNNLVKKVTVTVEYYLQSKSQTISMSKIKKREILITPNKPDLETLKNDNSGNIYPIKYSNGNWYVTDEKDSNWYNYENGNWAVAIVTNNTLEKESKITIDSSIAVKVWIPRYAYNTTDVKFLYNDTEKYVDDNKLIDIDNDEYTVVVPKWINMELCNNNNDFKNLNTKYPMKNIINT